jgi:hypothetical protein
VAEVADDIALRMPTQGNRISYRQAAVGGVIATGIVELIMSAHAGNLQLWPPTSDTVFIEKLRERASAAVAIPQRPN